VKNGEIVADGTVIDGETVLHYSDITTPSESNWYRLDVYDSNGAMLAITNPIFVGRRKHPQIQTYGKCSNLLSQRMKLKVSNGLKHIQSDFAC
jgi:hypothetical protein